MKKTQRHARSSSTKIFPLVERYESAVLDSKDKLWLLTDGFLQVEDASTTINLPDQIRGDAVLSLLWKGENLHIGTTTGMFTFQDDT